MTTVGIYVDGPNMERSLFDAGEIPLLENIATVLVEYSSSFGEITDKRLFLDEANVWRLVQTREDYSRNGFHFVESKSFKHLDPHTGTYIFGKSLTDPSMHCAIVDRLHDPDCPDLFVIVTGDKDVSIVLDYVAGHAKRAVVLGESHSMSGFLVSRCDALGFGCHIIQLVARSSLVMKDHVGIAPAPEVRSDELRVTDAAGKSVNLRRSMQYKDDRSNQKNPNNIAYWRSRGYHERPEDWENRAEQEKDSAEKEK